MKEIKEDTYPGKIVKTFGRKWEVSLGKLFHSAKNQIIISSPYFSNEGAKFLIEHASESFKEDGQLIFITDLSPLNICQGATEPESFKKLFKTFKKVKIFDLKNLHAKVYISDKEKAIVTSGNLTMGGLSKNYEYGIFLEEVRAVLNIKADLMGYAKSGLELFENVIEKYCEVAFKKRKLYKDIGMSEKRQILKELSNAFSEAKKEQKKIKAGEESLNKVFVKTILDLLEKQGPLKTRAIYDLVKEIHPKLCDDSINRVIKGVNYGEKWKHHLRAALEFAKKRGDIGLNKKEGIYYKKVI